MAIDPDVEAILDPIERRLRRLIILNIRTLQALTALAEDVPTAGNLAGRLREILDEASVLE